MLDALRRKVEDLLSKKDTKAFLKVRPDLYQVLNLVFNEEYSETYILLALYLEIRENVELRSGRFKPAFLDDLIRTVRFELTMRGCIFS